MGIFQPVALRKCLHYRDFEQSDLYGVRESGLGGAVFVGGARCFH